MTKLHLLGLFPMTGSWAAGGTLEPATRLAVNDINADDGILPGFQIEMINRDTAVREIILSITSFQYFCITTKKKKNIHAQY